MSGECIAHVYLVVVFLKKNAVFLSLKIDFVLANSADLLECPVNGISYGHLLSASFQSAKG